MIRFLVTLISIPLFCLGFLVGFITRPFMTGFFIGLYTIPLREFKRKSNEIIQLFKLKAFTKQKDKGEQN